MILLDAGHGGMINGQYTTAPNKMKQFEDGFTICEGVINRSIVEKLRLSLSAAGISNKVISHGKRDTPLTDRCRKIQEIGANAKNPVVVSVHCNYFHDPVAHGWQVHTYLGESVSDQLATYFLSEARDQYGTAELRKQAADDPDWDSNFMILGCHPYPAVLTENFFFSNREEAEYLSSDQGQEDIARLHLNAIKAWLKAT